MRLLSLKLFLLFFIIKGLFFISLIPPFDAPDEVSHIAYVNYLYNQKKVPSSSIPYISKSIQQAGRNGLFDRNSKNYTMKANVGSHPPLYYIYLIPFYILSLPFSSYGTIILLRIGSLILGTIALSLSLYITRLLFPQQIKLAYMTTFLLSVQPMFSFISSLVNIDIMTVVVF